MIWLNENNPYAAQWLRNLIAKGHLPHGQVDARSVLDVRSADLAGARQCHFFAGIGGWPYALDLAGWPRDREVWSASLPCQPLSVAGLRQGHVDERHLWPAFHDLVAERRPARIFGEQVASADGREWLAAVRHDLEALGYAVGAACLPACSVGAPHRRYRFFWVAHRLLAGRQGRLSGRANPQRGDLDRHLGRGGAAGLVADALHAQWRPLDLDRQDGRDGTHGDGRKHTASLEHAVKFAAWPTPVAEDGESSGARLSRGTADTLTAVTRLALGTTSSGSTAETASGGQLGQLNPMFSCWLMGFGIEWLMCAQDGLRKP